MSEKIKNCPVDNCNKPCTGAHRMKTHMIGAHVKIKNDFDNIISKVENKINEEPKDSAFWCNLLEKLKSCGPEVTTDDEATISAKPECVGGFDLESYFDKENPICREERQYAHFLATKIEQKDEEIIECLRRKLTFSEIVAVYYECTFMRDYWHPKNNKNEYNEKLINFIKNYFGINDKIKVGGKGDRHPNYWEKSHPYARWMTNAKPDIGLLVKNDKEKYTLHFLECKYLSGEDKYKAEGVKGKSQTEVQEMILEFLCSKDKENGLGLKYNGKSIVAAEEVKLVRFVKKEDDTNDGELQIEIRKLIPKKS